MARAADTPIPELQLRLVFSLLRPAIRLSRYFRFPLSRLEDLCRLGYFEELRRRENLSQSEVAQLLDLSLRTVGTLEKQYRGDFLSPEHEVERLRRIEEAFSHGPLTLAELRERLDPVDGPDLERAVDGLVGAGRLTPEGDADERRLTLNRRFVSLVRTDLKTRIDGLNHQLDVVVQAVRARFLAGPCPSTARTFSFMVDEKEAEALNADLVRLVRDRCTEAEERTADGTGSMRYGATIALAPMEEGERDR